VFVDVLSDGEIQHAPALSFYERGLACSVGEAADLIEAHKWFNLAATGGDGFAVTARAEVADLLTASEIVEAQRRARRHLLSRR
jgi:uncharacterized protein